MSCISSFQLPTYTECEKIGGKTMKFENPVIRGMYPDPSVTEVDGVWYLVNSSFEYFPGIPIFRSTDLVNWEQIGNIALDSHVLGLSDAPASSGIFAVTIRFHEGKFYIITTAFGRKCLRNFIMTAEHPEGPWSDPVFVPVDGIDPSLYWEGGKTYVQFTSFGQISQAVINEKTGEILEGPKVLTYGCGGRDAEGPHIFKREGHYYLLMAEGGTKDGHMVTLMRSDNIWGPYEASPYLPVISAVNYAGEPLQCIGHADLIETPSGRTYLICLGTRPLENKSLVGRETLLTEAEWTEDRWLRGKKPFVPLEGETEFPGEQHLPEEHVWDPKESLPQWMVSLRENPKIFLSREKGRTILSGNGRDTEKDLPFACALIRQSDFAFRFRSELSLLSDDGNAGHAGVLLYADPVHQISLSLSGSALHAERIYYDMKEIRDVEVSVSRALFTVTGNRDGYRLFLQPLSDDGKIFEAEQKRLCDLGFALDAENGVEVLGSTWKLLSAYNTDSQNTGVTLGIFASGTVQAEVHSFEYKKEKDIVKKMSFFKED
jgi:xylan 1,4-beta-xylosidase